MPNSGLESALGQVWDSWNDVGIESVRHIRYSLAPAAIDATVYSGHRYRRELDEEIDPDVVPFEREMTVIAPEPDWKTFW